jgi:hypothetical protein
MNLDEGIRARHTPWYQTGSANGIWSPKGSNGSCCCCSVGAADGAGAAFGAGGVAGGVGGVAAFLVLREPTWSLALYFLRMPSLWYFQNCLLASLPATRVRIFFPPGRERDVNFYPDSYNRRRERLKGTYPGALPGTVSGRKHPHRR